MGGGEWGVGSGVDKVMLHFPQALVTVPCPQAIHQVLIPIHSMVCCCSWQHVFSPEEVFSSSPKYRDPSPPMPSFFRIYDGMSADFVRYVVRPVYPARWMRGVPLVCP